MNDILKKSTEKTAQTQSEYIRSSHILAADPSGATWTHGNNQSETKKMSLDQPYQLVSLFAPGCMLKHRVLYLWRVELPYFPGKQTNKQPKAICFYFLRRHQRRWEWAANQTGLPCVDVVHAVRRCI